MSTNEQSSEQANEQASGHGSTGFTLIAGDDTIGPTDLSKLIGRKTGEKGPSTETLRKHAKRGTIDSVRDETGFRFKPAAADQWIANHPTPKRGGKRKGAGKRKNTETVLPSDTITGPVADAHAAKNAIKERIKLDDDGNRGPPPSGGILITDVLYCTRDELKALVYFNLGDGLMSSSAIDRLKELQALQFSDLKLAEKKGELVEANTIAAEWEREQLRIAEMVLDVPKQVAARIASVCWVSDEHTARICKLLKAEGVEGHLINAVANELNRPPELIGRVRSMIEETIGRVMAEVAKPPTEKE